MKIYKYLILVIFLSQSAAAFGASKSDLGKEKRWREQIVPALITGEAVNLKAGGSEFLGLYSENATEKASGAAIILHGIGVHPAWPDVIEPLRISLPEYGWHTLSLQMPILANTAGVEQYKPLIDEVVPRIQAGVAFLKAKGIRNIVIIAHSFGTGMGGHYLATSPDKSVRAFVAIGMGTFGFDERMNTLNNIPKINLPLLDIYGSEDLPAIVSSAQQRLAAARKVGRSAYQQVKVEGANHFFSNMDEILIKRVRGWLQRVASGTQIK